MSKSGKYLGPGKYICLKCNVEVVVKSLAEKVDKCSRCGGTRFLPTK